MSLLRFFSKLKYEPAQPMVGRGLFHFSGGTRISPDTAMEVSPFYSGVIYLSSQLAKLPWLIKDRNNKIMKTHFASKMLSLSPHPEINSFMLRLIIQQNALVEGNGYAEIERDMAGRAIRMHPIPARHVDPFRGQDNALLYRIVGGAVHGQGDAFVPAKDMFHIRNFHTKDGFTGMGLVDYGQEVLGIAKGADMFANSTYANGALPSGVLTTDKQLSEEAMKRLKESWEQNHKGRKVGNTAILEEGLTYNAISQSPEALQMLDSKRMSVLDIARFLRIPPTKLYDVTAATFDNQENSSLEVVTDTLDPWTRAWEMETDIKILSNQFGGIHSELDLFQAFRGDMESRGNFYKDLFGLGALSPNEIRELENKAAIEGGDKYFVASNNFTPIDRMDELLDSQINKSSENVDVNEALVAWLRNKKR